MAALELPELPLATVLAPRSWTHPGDTRRRAAGAIGPAGGELMGVGGRAREGGERREAGKRVWEGDAFRVGGEGLGGRGE